ncbi:hypothetical protein LTR86_009826 [Recurvomyces mirabilis]|nr:hypothetical protein LTR86_009826 [Recurvomyces mirabilis]
MIDPLSALGVAGAIVQFIDSGAGLITKTLEIYRSEHGMSDDIEQLKTRVERFQEAVEDIEAVSKPAGGGHPTAAEFKLVKLANECKSISLRFHADLQKVSSQCQAGRLESLKLSFRQMIRTHELERCKTEIEALRSEMGIQLLALLGNQGSQVLTVLQNLVERDRRLDAKLTTKFDGLQAEIQKAALPMRGQPMPRKDVERLVREHVGMYDDAPIEPGQLALRVRKAMDEESLALHKASSEAATTLADIVPSLQAQALNARYAEDVLEGLRYEQMQARRSQVHSRYTTTYEWIYNPQLLPEQCADLKLLDWLRAQSGIFWVSGKAGSGKSTLMKLICEDENTPGPCAVASGRYGESFDSQSFLLCGLLRSLCFEILRQCHHLIPVVCPERWHDAVLGRSGSEWSLAELEALVDRVSEQRLENGQERLRFCFFIDGLDEYEGDDQDIINILQRMAKSTNIKLCVSSRPWNNFKATFGGDTTRMLKLEDLTRDDIATFVQDQLLPTARHTEHVGLVDAGRRDQNLVAIANQITTKAQGVFLWVVLVVKALNRGLVNGDSFENLERRLGEMPASLEEFFKRMLANIGDFYKKDSARIFLLCERAAASLPLLGFAAMWSDLDDDFLDSWQLSADQVRQVEKTLEKRIIAGCQDLIEVRLVPAPVRHQRYHVDFIHRTARDYLATGDIHETFVAAAGRDFQPLHLLMDINLISVVQRPPDIAAQAQVDVCDDAQQLALYACEAEDIDRGSSKRQIDRLTSTLAKGLPIWTAYVLGEYGGGQGDLVKRFLFKHGLFDDANYLEQTKIADHQSYSPNRKDCGQATRQRSKLSGMWQSMRRKAV